MNTPMLITYRMFIAAIISTMPLLMFAQVKAADDYAHTTTNASSFGIKVLSNDNASNGILKIDKIPLYNHGTVAVNADSTEIIFTPEKDFKGVALVNYTVTDKNGYYDCGLVTIDVSATPSPAAQVMKLFTRPGEKITFTIPKGFGGAAPTNAQGEAQWVGGEGNGIYSFLPSRNFIGTEPTMFYFNKTENGIYKEYTVYINVVGSPVPVLLKDDYVNIPINGSTIADLYLNDNRIAKPISSFTVLPVSNPNYGVSSLTNGRVLITSNSNFKGTFNFDYEVTYVDGTKERAIVHTTVANYQPSADVFQVTAYHGIPYEFKYNIPLDNGGNWTFVTRNGGITSAGGRVTLNNKSEVVYTPPTEGQSDNFEVEYCVSGSGCKVVKVYVNLQPATAQICSTDCVFPGDANHDGIVDMWDLLTVGSYIGQYGSSRANANLSWMPTNAANWQQTLGNGVNAKNVDLNGDGIISYLDTVVISANYGKVNSIVAERTPEVTKIELQVLTTSNAAAPGDMIEITVLVGSSALPSVDARGLSYSVGYDADMIEENTLTVDFLQSNWLSRYDAYLAMSKIVTRGRIETGIARSQNRGASGHGEVSKIRAVVIDDLNGFQVGDRPVLRIRINDVYLMDAKGRMLQIEGKEIEIPIKLVKKDEPIKESDLLMFPNPSSDFMSFYLNGVNNIESLRIVDMMGKEVNRQNNIKGKQATVYFDNFAPGMYLAEVTTEKGKIMKKIQVVK